MAYIELVGGFGGRCIAESGQEESMTSSDIRCNIARWALPRENIPLRLEIENDIEFDFIIIHLPFNFELVEMLNSDDYYIFENDVIIRSIKKSKHRPGIFFGLVIKYEGIPVNLKLRNDISVEFIKNDSRILSCNLECRIFRPSLTIMNVPTIIELKDNLEANKIGLDLQFIGFGDITIKIEAMIGGKIVSEGNCLLYELLFRMTERLKAAEKDLETKNNSIKIKPEFVRRVVERVQRLIYNKELPSELLTDEEIDKLKEYFFEIKKQENFSETIFEVTNNILLSILSDTLDRTPKNNIELEDIRTNIKTKINVPINEIILKIRYKDLMENEYPSHEIRIPVDDKLTTHRDKSINIPITIENIDNQHFMNVKDMNMGA